jgi:PAS domain S-box-containing protein
MDVNKIRAVVLLIWVVFFLSPPVTHGQSATPKRILVLYWYDREYAGHIKWDQSFQSELQAIGSGSLQHYSEYLEANRFPGDHQSQALSDYLQQKYAEFPPDVVVAHSEASLNFLLKNRKDLFPNAPIVFYVASRPNAEGLAVKRNLTGVIIYSSFKKNLELALSLQPLTRQVFVVSGTLEHDKVFEEMARAELKDYDDRLQINYLTNLSPNELVAKTRSLPERSIVLFVWQQSRDEQGKLWETSEIVDLLVQTTPAPIYTISGPQIGHGVIGGYVYTPEASAAKVATIVQRILNGERAQDIPIEPAPTMPIFDWRELRRWNISEDKLPPGSVVNFRQFTFWQLYKWRIIGVLALIALQTLLIAFLLIERRRLRVATEALRQSETRFRNMADNAPVMIWISGTDNLVTYVNKQLLDFTGRTMEQELANGWEGVHPDDYGKSLETYTTSFDSRKRFEMEYRLRRADGEYRWILANGTPRFASDGEFLGYIGSCIEITERKESEVALTKAHEELSQLKNQLEAENVYLQSELQLNQAFGEIVGQSDAIKHVHFKINQVAATDLTVLIMGETGTGKELVARAIHAASNRKDRRLIKVDCAALSASLIESELFGHEKGAFTGAGARKLGRFELANAGTIFLDEIGELPLELQVKLLRVIQEGELERVGGTKTIKIDVRIIAATNRHLQQEVENGTFREDLWYRLNVFPITAPPLRHRREDIPLLVEHFVKTAGKKFGKTLTSMAAGTMQNLQTHSWPGNVRELANVIERSVIHSQGSVLRIVDRFEQTLDEPSTSVKSLEEVEKHHIIRVLEQTGWRIEGPSGAAHLLELKPSTLRARMVKLGIQRGASTFA